MAASTVLGKATSVVKRIWGPWRATYDAPITLGLSNPFPESSLSSVWTQTYTDLYRREPAVRTCVDFLARNIAQVGVHIYRRLEDDSRIRERTHPAARLLAEPNPIDTAYTFLERTVQDLCIYGAAIWVKVDRPGQTPPIALYELSPAKVKARWETVTAERRQRVYEVTWPDGHVETTTRDRLIIFSFYDPDGGIGLSPLETLRPILAETRAAARYREFFFRNGSRMSGVIERPKDAPRWTPEQKAKFVEDWQSLYSGAAAAGRTAILEDGMVYKNMSYSAEQSQLLEAKKLGREEVAAAYHIPLPMVGILDHATFSNIKEQHKQLYQDCLGPWFAMLEQEINRGVLASFTDSDGLYAEFNISEKLQGAFEEQLPLLQAACGGPVMTVNEGRARVNLPRIDNALYDQPILPLNTAAGQDAAATPPVDPAGAAATVH